MKPNTIQTKKQNIKENAKNKVLDFFASLADETRLKILLSIAKKPKNVNEIYDFVGRDKITLSAISHQLNHLKNLTSLLSKIKQSKSLR